ncbi:MAG: hypothetical protein AAFU71_01500 [Cyanobacteria bacterium J06632_22]
MQDFLVGFQIKLYDYLLDTLQTFFRYPAHFLLRKLGRFQVLRNWVIYWRLHKRRSPDCVPLPDTTQTVQPVSSVVKPLQTRKAAVVLRRHGLLTGLQLGAAPLSALQTFARQTLCYGDRDPACPFNYGQHALAQTTYQRTFALANYPTVGQTSVLQQLRQDPTILEIAENYLQVPPVFVGSELWWSFAASTDPLTQCKAAQVFHCDIDDYRAIRFFFYLTDVDAHSGPHMYIQGSHRQKSWLHQLAGGRATEASLKVFYGDTAITTIHGPAGIGFAEDSFGYHMGQPPQTTDRLMLVMLFTMQDYGAHPGLRPLRSRPAQSTKPSPAAFLTSASIA